MLSVPCRIDTNAGSVQENSPIVVLTDFCWLQSFIASERERDEWLLTDYFWSDLCFFLKLRLSLFSNFIFQFSSVLILLSIPFLISVSRSGIALLVSFNSELVCFFILFSIFLLLDFIISSELLISVSFQFVRLWCTMVHLWPSLSSSCFCFDVIL